MTWLLTYYTASQLVWGRIEPGAPSFCPGQREHVHEQCIPDAPNYCEARCTVTAVVRDSSGRLWVRMVEVRK